MPSRAERRRRVGEKAKEVDIDKKQLTYEGLNEAESCSNGAGSLDPVKADDHVVPGGEPELGGVQSVSQAEHFIRNKEKRLNLPFGDLDHVVHLLNVLRLQSDSTDGEDKTRGQIEDQVDQANDQSPHLQFVA